MNPVLEKMRLANNTYAEIGTSVGYLEMEAETVAFPVIRSVDGVCIDGSKDHLVQKFNQNRMIEDLPELKGLTVLGKKMANANIENAAENGDENWLDSPDAIKGFAMHALAKQREMRATDILARERSKVTAFHERERTTNVWLKRIGISAGGIALGGSIALASIPEIDLQEKPGLAITSAVIGALCFLIARIGRNEEVRHSQAIASLAA